MAGASVGEEGPSLLRDDVPLRVVRRAKVKRAIFKEPGAQARFLRAVKERVSLTWKETAQLYGCSERTIHDWLSERCTMPAKAVEVLGKLSGVTPPPYEAVSELDLWRRKAASKGGRKGGRTGGKRRAELYADLVPKWGRKGRVRQVELYSSFLSEWSRKAAQKLWELRRKHPERYKPVGGVKEIQIPGRSVIMAELCGILLGDGHIDDTRVAVCLHDTNEVEYSQVAAWLFEQLFSLEPKIEVRSGNSRVVIAHSVRLVRYLTSEEIGLKKRDKVKQQVGVPNWILGGGREYWMACVRGLMDTDGGLFRDIDRRYSPPHRRVRLIFRNCSIPLLDGMEEMLQKLDYHPRKHVRHHCLHLNRQEEVRRYYREIGTRNAYHRDEYTRKAWEAWGENVSDEIKFLG